MRYQLSFYFSLLDSMSPKSPTYDSSLWDWQHAVSPLRRDDPHIQAEYEEPLDWLLEAMRISEVLIRSAFEV
jgi:hypothetical protein